MKLLQTIRLSWFFVGFLVIFTILAFVLRGISFDSSALALFSVNSFLYGFYISPILGTQKGRIDDLQKTIRAEANALFTMVLKTKKLNETTRNQLQSMFTDYMHAITRQHKPGAGEKEYEALIGFCLNYKGEDSATIDKILDGLVANQQNRSQMSMLLKSRVFSNEWMIVMILFGITLGFIVFFQPGHLLIMKVVKALLCTGLTMLIINLLKLSTLTHKKAKNLWDPLKKLESTHFYAID